MRRRAGIGAIQKQRLQQNRFKEKGTEIQENQLEQMVQQMEKFRTNLEDYAAKHKNEIRKNPQFRRQFQEMCASIGVDPLASGRGESFNLHLPQQIC
ncbi:EAP30 [Trinorchestia longiramus]|nr:EAP30 [Trinorchestia longiramus]